jgi:hypothetical protein
LCVEEQHCQATTQLDLHENINSYLDNSFYKKIL